MTAHRASDNTMIDAAADQRLQNARKYFLQTATDLANATDATLEALWLDHDSASRGLRTEALAEMRRKAGVVPSVAFHRLPPMQRGTRELLRRGVPSTWPGPDRIEELYPNFVCGELSDGA
jgi:hypothetical protein